MNSASTKSYSSVSQLDDSFHRSTSASHLRTARSTSAERGRRCVGVSVVSPDKKKSVWVLVGVIVLVAVAIVFAIGQALTFAWLSALPGREAQLPSLQIRFWSYAVGGFALLVAEVVLIVRLVKCKRKRSAAPPCNARCRGRKRRVRYRLECQVLASHG